MPDDNVKFSDAIASAEASALYNDDVYALAQVDAQSPTGYSSKATRFLSMAQKIAKATDFSSDLSTTSPYIIGAINELAASGGNITTEINTPASVQTFADGGNGTPLASCEVEIEPSVGGVSSVNISVKGQNYIDMSTIAMRDVDANHTQRAGYAPFELDAGTYDLTFSFSDGTARQVYVQNADTFANIANGNSSYTFTLTARINVLIRTSFLSVDTVKIDSITLYNASVGQTITISLGETLTQGGTLEAVSGLLTRTDTTTSQLTGANIPTLSGINNIFADTGDINALEYYNSKADKIAKLINLMTR